MSTTIREQLRTLSFLDGLTDTALHQLSQLVKPAEYECDAVLFTEGSERQLLAIVVSGAVAIEKQINGRPDPPRHTRRGRGRRRRAAPRRFHARHERSRARRHLRATSSRASRSTEMIKEIAHALRRARRPRGARDLAAALRRGRHDRGSRARARIRRRAHVASSTTCSASARCRTTRSTACRRCARSRTSRSPACRCASSPRSIEALAAVKEAAALANARARAARRARSPTLIVRAAREIRAGRHHEHFLVDMIQGGAGTSTNMNANEVIANRALELSGHERGEYQFVHPNNHVNLSQSTNDVYPTAVKLALHTRDRGAAPRDEATRRRVPRQGRRVLAASSRWAARSSRTRCR